MVFVWILALLNFLLAPAWRLIGFGAPLVAIGLDELFFFFLLLDLYLAIYIS